MPFVTQYQPSVSTLKEVVMEKWNLIQNQPLLRQFFKEPLSLTSYKTERKIPKRHARQSKIIKGLHKVSHRYGCAACQPLHPLILILFDFGMQSLCHTRRKSDIKRKRSFKIPVSGTRVKQRRKARHKK